MKYLDHIISHRKCIIALEKHLTGKNTWAIKLHDLDKVILTRLGVSKNRTHKIHRFFSRHHAESFWIKKNVFEMFLDWECARYTKPDKPLTAIETAQKYYPQHLSQILDFQDKYAVKLVDFKF